MVASPPQQPWLCHFLLARAAVANSLPPTHPYSPNTLLTLSCSHTTPHLLLLVCIPSPPWWQLSALTCVHIFFLPTFSFLLQFVFHPPLSNKVNEDGKWWDSRWYFSKALPSNNGAAAGRKPQSLWMKCARAGLCITSTGLEQRLDLYIGL